MTYEKWKQNWRISSHGMRLGQAFIHHVGGNFPALYYEEDYWKADIMIEKWLLDNSYYPDMPPKWSPFSK